MGNAYQEYKDARQAEFDALPIFWAFGDWQFNEQCEKLGIEPEKAGDYLYRFGGNGFYLKSDAEKIHAFINKEDPLDELMKNPDFAYDAFYYEMGNHEYHINYQADWDVCNCFCSKGELPYYGNTYDLEKSEMQKYFEYLGWGTEIQQAYRKARRDFYKKAEENDWF